MLRSTCVVAIQEKILSKFQRYNSVTKRVEQKNPGKIIRKQILVHSRTTATEEVCIFCELVTEKVRSSGFRVELFFT